MPSSCIQGPHLPLCHSAPLGLCRWVTGALKQSPVMDIGVAGQDIVWTPHPAVMSLYSFVGVQMRFCQVTNCEQAQLGMWFKEQVALGDREVSIWYLHSLT